MPDIVEVDQVFQQRHELRPLDETIVSRVGSLVRLDIPSKPLEGKRDIVKKTRRKREENGRKRKKTEENVKKTEENVKKSAPASVPACGQSHRSALLCPERQRENQ